MTYPTLTFASARALIQGCIASRQNMLLLGAPGVGKSSLVLGLDDPRPVEVIIASTCDPTDFGGLPVVQGDSFTRIPMAQIRRAANEPIILFFDEITTAAPSVQAACLRGLSERVFGDIKLHPDTIMIAAGNPPEQAPGGYDLAPPTVGRFGIWNFEPTNAEFREYFATLGDDGSDLRSWAEDFSATASHAPDLIQAVPPESAVRDAAQWAAPRNWERAFRILAACPGADDTLQFSILAGCVGESGAASYLGIRKLRAHLPSVESIVADPEGAPVPETVEYQIGALGLLANVAATDTGSAWLYASRLRPEVGAACAAALKAKPWRGKKHTAAGRRAMAKLVGRVGAALR